jgi:flagellar hook assembly protein FlgD
VRFGFRLATAERDVQVSIYDVKGRKLRTVALGARGAGEQFTTWDRRDDRGIVLSRGVYFVRLTAGPVERARKIVLVRP